MKKIIIIVTFGIVAGLGIMGFNQWQDKQQFSTQASDKDLAKYAVNLGRTNAPLESVLTPIALSRQMRLAIGGLGPADDEQNQLLGDLVTAKLTSAPGLSLVDRQSLGLILSELKLSLHGFVRANDAVRIGHLLKTDWFLLGTEARINGTNCIVARLVDAHTGITRDAGVFPARQLESQLASDLASFVKDARQKAASAKASTYLAISGFQNVGVNNRQTDFPTQLRGYLTGAYHGGNVTMLEREYVETLLREVHLDMAGLTEDSSTNPLTAMQSAYWLVSGQYQSYETTNLQVEVNLEIQRVFGRIWHFTLRGLPGDAINKKIKATLDQVMRKNQDALFPTRMSEARTEMEIGKDLSRINNGTGDIGDWIWIAGTSWSMDSQLAAKQRYNLQEAIRAFQTVLLLEPTNREVKLYLAGCLRNPVNYDSRLNYHPDEARNYYREMIDQPVQDKWTRLAEAALKSSFDWSSSEERFHWFQAAAMQTANPVAVAFYRQQAKVAEKIITIRSGGAGKSAASLKQQLIDQLHSFDDYLHDKIGAVNDLGLEDYIKASKLNRPAAAQKMAELLPDLTNRFPNLAPYLLAKVLTFQINTNTPLETEFEAALKDWTQHPERIPRSDQFWIDISWQVYDWCMEQTNYSLAIKLIESERQMVGNGERVVHEYDENGKVRTVYLDFDDMEKVKLAYLYMAVDRWQDALDIVKSFNNRPVQVTVPGIWGDFERPVLTDKLADYCRQKLGIAAKQDPRKFDIGKPLLCLYSPSTFLVGEDGLWVGAGGQLLHLDFDLRTNLAINLPMDSSIPIKALCLDSSRIWIGTQGAGLIEFNKSSHHCRLFTEADGLMMNDLVSLALNDNLLWIGYGSDSGGGLGQLNLRNNKITSFTPSLIAASSTSVNGLPPQDGVGKIVASRDGDLWMFSGNSIREFHVAQNTWQLERSQSGQRIQCFAKNSNYLVQGNSCSMLRIEIQDRPDTGTPAKDLHKESKSVSLAELDSLKEELQTNGSNRYVCYIGSGEIPPKGLLAIHDLHNHRWQTLEDADGLPFPPNTLTLDGNYLWVGGKGFITLVDLKENEVKKFCHIRADSVDRIQIAGGYVWAQFGGYLYRVALSELR